MVKDTLQITVTTKQLNTKLIKKDRRPQLEETNHIAILVTLKNHLSRSHVFIRADRIVSMLVDDHGAGEYPDIDYYFPRRTPREYTKEIWTRIKNHNSKPMFWLLHTPEDIKDNQNEETIWGFQGFTGKESEEQYLKLNSHSLGWEYQNEINHNLSKYPNYHNCRRFRITPTLEDNKRSSIVKKHLPTIGGLQQIDPTPIINFPRDLKDQKIMFLALNPKYPTTWKLPYQIAFLCQCCAKEFVATDKRQRFCTTECRIEYHNIMRKNKAIKEKRSRLNKEDAPRCVVCGGLLNARSDAETCGDQCRQRKYRAGKKKN